MKKKRFLSFKKRAKDTLKKWSVSSFFQQLTVVVLGIFITFSGNSFFQERSTQRKLKATLVLVKKELLSNQKMLQEVLTSFKHEQAFASELKINKNDLTQIDSSYLVNNQSVFFHLDARRLETDALEVLKTSSLIQDFKDPNLCFELLSTYSSIEKALRVYHFFMDLKRSRNQKLYDDQVYTAKMKAFSEKATLSTNFSPFC